MYLGERKRKKSVLRTGTNLQKYIAMYKFIKYSTYFQKLSVAPYKPFNKPACGIQKILKVITKI
jgi:hypothetical protein